LSGTYRESYDEGRGLASRLWSYIIPAGELHAQRFDKTAVDLFRVEVTRHACDMRVILSCRRQAAIFVRLSDLANTRISQACRVYLDAKQIDRCLIKTLGV